MCGLESLPALSQAEKSFLYLLITTPSRDVSVTSVFKSGKYVYNFVTLIFFNPFFMVNYFLGFCLAFKENTSTSVGDGLPWWRTGKQEKILKFDLERENRH